MSVSMKQALSHPSWQPTINTHYMSVMQSLPGTIISTHVPGKDRLLNSLHFGTYHPGILSLRSRGTVVNFQNSAEATADINFP